MKQTRPLPPDDFSPPVQSAGESVMRAGLICLFIALALGMLPWFAGLGLLWSVLLAALGAAVWHEEKGNLVRTSWLAPLLAMLVVVQSYRMLSLSLIALVWLAAAYLLAKAQWTRWAHLPEYSMQWQRVKSGYRLYVALGAALCWIGIAQTWGRTPGHFWGGLQSQLQNVPVMGSDGYYSMELQMRSTYNPIMYSTLGFEYSGRSLNFATWALFATLLLALWAMCAPSTQGFVRGLKLSRWALGFAALWWVFHRAPEAGSYWFFAGLLLCGFGLWKLARGEETGQHDAAHLLRQFRKK